MKTITRTANDSGTAWVLTTENNAIEYTSFSEGLRELLKIEALNHKITARPKTFMTPEYLYKAWYKLFEPLSDMAPYYIGEPVEVNFIDMNSLACAYQHFFKEENMLGNISPYYKEFKEYDGFLKHQLNFDIEQYKEDTPAAFV